MFREERARLYKGIALCVALFVLGYVLLEWVSVKEDPILGNTFHIVAGYLFMAAALVGIGLILRKLYRLRKKQKRRKSGSPVVFLDDEKQKQTHRQASNH
ncbi:hypothetical protein [Flavobacterium selenitireducens]|uniref:hypothetical protein n=1 Tax=Flavobacterium selenitireducens TaxID=2722704 RepID=UPI00168BFD1D|nr:hypothetical protein [Flavobacterium selenitireducens]MBD3582926.1 hypothetical protein [Flavobacterium selenitireducens]